MSENKSNKVSVKIYEHTRDLMEREKMRFKVGARPDYADIIGPAVESWLAATGDAAPVERHPQTNPHQKWHDLLDVVLKKGSPKQAEWLSGNLVTFVEAIRLKEGIAAEASPEHVILAEDAEEIRLLTDFRSATFNQRQRMMAEGARNQEKPGPEAMPTARRTKRRSG